MLKQPLLERNRRDRHPFEPGRLGIAGDIIKDARDIASDYRIGGKERNVGIYFRRHRMVIAGADMAIGDEGACFTAHDHR